MVQNDDRLPPLVFSGSFTADDALLIQSSALLARWYAEVRTDFHVHSIEIQSADIVERKGMRFVLFLKIKAQATDLMGNRVGGIVLLRGNAVAVLVVLWCQEQPWLLLVDQPRFAIARRHSLEIPAGILDWSQDPRAVALEELHEEAGMIADDQELIDLDPLHQDGGIAASCGLLDERIKLFAVERTVDEATLRSMDGKDQEYLDENENIRTVVLPYQEAVNAFRDGKCLNAAFLYERWLREQGRTLP